MRARLWPDQTNVDFTYSIHAATDKLRQALGDFRTSRSLLKELTPHYNSVETSYDELTNILKRLPNRRTDPTEYRLDRRLPRNSRQGCENDNQAWR